MKKGDIILCPLFSLSHRIEPVETGKDMLFEIIKKNDTNFLRYEIDNEDLNQSIEEIFIKFRLLATGLSVSTLGHHWVNDVLFDSNLEKIWEGSRSISLVKDKEILPNGPVPLNVNHFIIGEDVMTWIAKSYPRVFRYYHIGLWLLRSSFSTEYLYADALLNFFKIVEIIVCKREMKKPTLGVIKKVIKDLKLVAVDVNDVKRFYIVRSQDAAHDWDKVEVIDRMSVAECKMWADEMILKDLMDRMSKVGVCQD